jgi:hypothetical protein
MGSDDASSFGTMRAVSNDVSNPPPLILEDFGFQAEGFAVPPEEAEKIGEEPYHVHPHRI